MGWYLVWVDMGRRGRLWGRELVWELSWSLGGGGGS